jgi:hypothetical protein
MHVVCADFRAFRGHAMEAYRAKIKIQCSVTIITNDYTTRDNLNAYAKQ